VASPVSIHANLDIEATWAGVALPERVQRRISAVSALLAALTPEPCEIWAPAAVEPARLLAAPGWRVPIMRVGAPPRADLAWADLGARAANDRRLALAVNAAAGSALPGARTIASLDELDAGTGSPQGHWLAGAWVCKAPWTSAGRDRCHGRGVPSGETRVRLGRMLATFGALVVEPWLDRVLDVGTCATVSPTGSVSALAPHELLTDARGGFLGIRLAPPALTAAERDRAAELVDAAGRALAALGYVGRFAVDAFVYRDGDTRQFHPLCEINARHTFGWVAHALAERIGTKVLGFGAAPPGATVLVAPGASDPATAWVTRT
jgi:hypothetical protein